MNPRLRVLHFRRRTAIALLGAAIAGSVGPSDARAAAVFLAARGGIFRAQLDDATGALTSVTRATAVKTGFLALHPTRPELYSFYDEGGEHGVASYVIDPDGSLTPQSRRALPFRDGTHLSLNPTATLLATAFYNAGFVVVLRVQADGSLGATVLTHPHEGRSVNPARQDRAHPHWTGFSRDGRFLFVNDLGTDEIWSYDVASDGVAVTPAGRFPVPAGFGPRHLAFSPDHRFAWLSCELAGKVCALAYDADRGRFSLIAAYDTTAPGEFTTPPSASNVAVGPTGRFVYVGNRGHDSIAVFAVDPATGRLTPVERAPVHGSWPRHFDLDRTGRWLVVLGQRSNTVTTFRVDPATGRLRYSGHQITLPEPMCVVFPR